MRWGREGGGGLHGDKSQTRVEGLYRGGRDAGRKEGCVRRGSDTRHTPLVADKLVVVVLGG